MPATDLAWTKAYVGLPFQLLGRDRAGVDCWGLVRLVLAERTGVILPSFLGDYTSVDNLDELGGPDRRRPPRLDQGRGRRERRSFDVAVFKRADPRTRLQRRCHVGLVAGPRHLLHITKKLDVHLPEWLPLEWRRRFDGVYRHAALA